MPQRRMLMYQTKAIITRSSCKGPMTEANWNMKARIDAISSGFSFVTHLLDEAQVRAGWDEFCE